MAKKTRGGTEPADGLEAMSRRGFLKGIGAAGIAASLAPLGTVEAAAPHGHAGATLDVIPDAPILAQTQRVVTGAAATVAIMLDVNGQAYRAEIDPRASLLDTLRETLHLTGTKKGCDHGQCGACTVHINGRRANSCLSLALTNQGDKITTIEGLGTPGKLHPMQAAFVAHDGYQCGYCTSGQIMSAVALTKESCGPDDADVKELMSGNICRCGAYANIVDAIQQIRQEAK
jgi:xanthine dehydrogenase YagT iron-sulfur-binding subunit